MTGDELKLIREDIGITQEKFVQIAGIGSLITLKRWENNQFRVPEYIEKMIYEMYKAHMLCVDKLYNRFKDAKERIILVRFSGTTAFARYNLEIYQYIDYKSYNKAVNKAYFRLFNEQKRVSVITFDPIKYEKFIKEQGLKDHLDSVYTWAAYDFNNKWGTKEKGV